MASTTARALPYSSRLTPTAQGSGSSSSQVLWTADLMFLHAWSFDGSNRSYTSPTFDQRSFPTHTYSVSHLHVCARMHKHTSFKCARTCSTDASKMLTVFLHTATFLDF